MDRNLRIRLLLEAGDRVTKPLRDIAQGSSKTAQVLKATRDRLKEIERAQADVAGFRELKAGLRSTDQAMQAAQTRVGQLAREIEQADRPTKKLTGEFAKAKREAAALKAEHGELATRTQAMRDRMAAAGIATGNLATHERELRHAAEQTNQELAEQERRLQQVTERSRRFAAGRERFGRVQGAATSLAAGGAAAIGTGVAAGAPIVGSIKGAMEYQSVMTDIAQKANLSREEARKMGLGLIAAAKAANQLPEALQEGVDALAGFGLDPRKAVAMMRPIGRAATAYKAEIKDLSSAAFAANDNLRVPVEQTARVIDIMAQAGKSGAFEIKDMAQYFPELTAASQALGQKGVPAVADLAAALQIARKGAGDSAQAANNVSNLLQKMASPEVIKNFAKYGIDLPNALKKAYQDGKTPIEAIIALTNQAVKGDLGKLGFLFGDMQVQQALRPLIQNVDEYKRIRADALAAKGVTDTDFAERLQDGTEQAKKFQIAAKALGLTVGSLLLPGATALMTRLSGVADRLGALADRFPIAAKVAAYLAAGAALLLITFGGLAIAAAGLLAPFAALSFVAGAFGIGLLPVIGIAAGVVAGLAALAAGAYLIYANWGAVSGWFGQLWSGIRSIFAGGIIGILQAIVGWQATALGLLVRFGIAAFGWLTGTLPGLLARGWSAAWGGLKSAVIDAFTVLPGMFYDFGANIVRGLVRGILSAPAALANAAISLAHTVTTKFKAAAGIRSPSRVFMGLGGHIVQGLTNGIAGAEDEPARRMEWLAGRMAAAMTVGGNLAGSSRDIVTAMALGAAVPAMAAPALAAPNVQRGPAASGPVTIQIYQQPGESGDDLARKIRDILRDEQRRGGGAGGRGGGSYADDQTWG